MELALFEVQQGVRVGSNQLINQLTNLLFHLVCFIMSSHHIINFILAYGLLIFCDLQNVRKFPYPFITFHSMMGSQPINAVSRKHKINILP